MTEDKFLPVSSDLANRPRRAVGFVAILLTLGLLLVLDCGGAV